MKKLLLLITCCCVGISAAGLERTFHGVTAGTLCFLIPEREWKQVTDLTLSGRLNATDIYIIRVMAGCGFHNETTDGQLKRLNLEEVELVPSDTVYFVYPEDVPHYINANTIDAYLFYGCNQLESIKLPRNITVIGDYAFRNFTHLTEITIPNSVTTIGQQAFLGCTDVTNVTFGTNVATIGQSAFQGCTGLTNVSLGNSVTSVGQYAFHGCTGLTTVTLGQCVTTIGQHAFHGCTNLRNVTLGQSVTSIGARAFLNCLLDTLFVKNPTPPTLGDEYVFYSPGSDHDAVYENCRLYVPKRSDDAYRNDTQYGKYGWSGFEHIYEEGLTLKPRALSLTVGDPQKQITASLHHPVNPATAISWESLNPDVATVNNGSVTAKAAGTATIRAFTSNPNDEDACIVTVTAAPVTGVSLDKTTLTLNKDATAQLNATVVPDYAANKKVTWSSSQPGVVKITATTGGQCTIQAVGAGRADITVTTEDGNKKATCAVTVPVTAIPVTGVSLNKTNLPMKKGDKEQLTATVSPEDATNKTVSWSSDNDNMDVATVDNNGWVTATGAGTAIITATADGQRATCEVTVTVSVDSVTLNSKTLTLNTGKTFLLQATVWPDDATNKTVSWRSSNEDMVTIENIDNNCLVTAKGAGTAIITVATEDGDHKSVCTVTVTVPVTGVSLDNKPNDAPGLTLKPGETFHFDATVWPDNATNKNVRWSSDNKNVATVDNNGWVTAKAVGTAIITATTEEGGFTATCQVTVTMPVAGVLLNNTRLTLKAGETFQFVATVSPPDATHPSVTWSSSDPSVATINDEGWVTAKSAGTAIITATTEEGQTATCEVTVKVPVDSVLLNKDTLLLNKDATLQLYVTILPGAATNKEVTWRSSDPSVATINDEGLVTATGAGTAIIVVTSADDETKEDSCVVRVRVPVASVSLSKTTLTLTLDKNVPAQTWDTVRLFAAVLPDNAANKAVTWRSSDPAVAEVAAVDTMGRVTATGAGTAVITVFSNDDPNKTATCRVTVNVPDIPVTGVTLNRDNVTIEAGSTWQLIATIEPYDATTRAITWRSLDPDVAIVSDDGLVTAQAAGTARIVVATVDGNKTATCAVVVPAIPVTGVSLDNTALTLTIGAKSELIATVLPGNATNSAVRWRSSDTSVVKIESVDWATALVTAKAAGTATLTVVTVDGNKTATCMVVVPAIPVTSISLSATTLSLNSGSAAQLIASLLPDNATDKTVTWKSSDTTVARTDASGLTCLVKAVGVGAAIITVTNGSGMSATCVVTVAATAIPVMGVLLSDASLTLNKGDTTQLTASVRPVDATIKGVSWRSSNSAVVTVIATPDGGQCTVKAVGTGSATITVTTDEGYKTDTCKVTVKVPVTGVSLNDASLTLNMGSTAQLIATIRPADAKNKAVTWRSSNSAVATVAAITDGQCTVKAVGAGSATITVTTDDGEKTATCEVTVKVPVTGISLDKTNLSIGTDETAQLNATILPGNATDPSVTWQSSDTSVIKVYGKVNDVVLSKKAAAVLPIAAGTAYVLVTTADGRYMDMCEVTVTLKTGIPVLPSPAEARITDGVLYLNTPESETISLYSITGVLLFKAGKTAGEAFFPVNAEGKVLILKGSSGWVRKIVQ